MPHEGLNLDALYRRYRRYMQFHREREARGHTVQHVNAPPRFWTSDNLTPEDLFFGEAAYQWDMASDKAKGYRPVKQPRHRLFNRRLPL